MSVMIIARVKGDPEKIKQVFAEHASDMETVSSAGKAAGAISHRFLEGDGEIIIHDEWDTAENFEQFFSSQPMIGQMMAEAGVTGPPDVSVYKVLTTAGDF